MSTRGFQWPVVLRVGFGTSGGVAALAMAKDGGRILAVFMGCPTRPDHLCRQAPASPAICSLHCGCDIVLCGVFSAQIPHAIKNSGDQGGKREVGGIVSGVGGALQADL